LIVEYLPHFRKTGTIIQILMSDYVVNFGDKILSQVFKEERLEKITENSNSPI
jgi:hypothetical protein